MLVLKILGVWRPTDRTRCCCLVTCLNVVKSCPTLCDPMDCSPPSSSDHRISQARILDWVATSNFKRSFRPKDQTCVSCIVGEFFTPEPPEKISSWTLSHKVFFWLPGADKPLLLSFPQGPSRTCGDTQAQAQSLPKQLEPETVSFLLFSEYGKEMGKNLCSRRSDFTTGNKPTGNHSYFLQKAILSSSLHLTSVAHLLISSLHFVYLWIHSRASLVAHGKESTCNVGDLGSIPGFRRSPRGGHGNPLQCACLENPMDKGAWRSAVHGGHKESELSS